MSKPKDKFNAVFDPGNLFFDKAFGSGDDGSVSGKVSFTPVQYQETEDYKKALSELSKIINQSNFNTSGVASSLRNYYDTALSPGYSALSKEQMQNLYNQGVETLKPQFKEMESNLGSRMANQGLAGSGIAGAEWSGLGKKQSEALTGVYNNIYNQNLAATQQNISNALSSTSALTDLYQQPTRNASLLTSIYGSDQAAKNAWEQWNAQMKQQAQMANAGILQQAQAAKDAQQQQALSTVGNIAASIFASGK